MSQALELLHDPFVQRALLVALMVAAFCSYLGVFVVLKRIVFVGAALAEVSGFGAAVALYLTAVLPFLKPVEHYFPLVMALGLMLVAVAVFSQQRLSRRLPREAIIGATYAAAVGLTLLALSQNPSGESHHDEILNGNILTVQTPEIVELAVTCVVVGLIQALFFKEFMLVSFDPEVAQTLGYKSSRWELLWYLVLGVMIAVSIHVAGTILVFVYLVVPPVTGLMVTRQMRAALIVSILAALVATAAGVLISVLDFQNLPASLHGWVSPSGVPTSYAIMGCAVAVFVLAWLGKTLFDLAHTARAA